MEPDDEPEDEGSSGPLLPAADRLWRHPSEMAVLGRSMGIRPTDHRMWTVAVFAGLVGAVLATGMTFATGSMRTHTVSVPAIEQDLMTPVVTVASAGPLALATLVQHVRSSCVTITTHDSHGPHVSNGVVFRSDGMVLTTAHTLSGRNGLVATVDGSRRVGAHVVAVDPASDLAVVKLDGSGYTPAPMGTALHLRIGDPVIAVRPSATPTSTKAAVDTKGWVTAFGKTMPTGGTSLDGLLQITTSEPPDTLGGPVLDGDGAVVAIASVLAGSGQREEFATPVDWAREVAVELLNSGRVVPVWLGVLGHDLAAAAAAAISATGGAVVDKVYSSSPAAAAGLEAGDLVLGIDGQAVTSMANLIMAVHARPVDSQIQLNVRRDGSDRTISVVLEPRPAVIS